MDRTIFKKVQRESYTIVSNQAVHDTTLSWKATGLLTYLLSLPQDWSINAQDLANRKKDGLSSLRSGIEELEEHGYLRRFKARDEEGQFAAHVIQVREDLEVEWPESPYCDSPQVDNPQVENPSVENHTLLSTHTTKETTIPSTQVAAPSGAGSVSGEISALDWDNSGETLEAVSKSLATRFYSWCRQNGQKRPAVKHKAFVNLIDDLLERGYHEDEVWNLLQAHHADGFAWTLNSISVTESKIRRERNLEWEFDSEEERLEYEAIKARRAARGK